MLEAALSTSPVVTRLLVGALVRPQKHVSRAPPCRRNMVARALCITISDDRGDESFADDLNMGRGIVSGRVALLLRSTEIRPHRPNDLLPPSNSQTPGSLSPIHTWSSHTWCFPKRHFLLLDLHSGVQSTPAPQHLARRGDHAAGLTRFELNRTRYRESHTREWEWDTKAVPPGSTIGTPSQRHPGLKSGLKSGLESGLAAGHPTGARIGTLGGTPSRRANRDSQRDTQPALESGLAAGLEFRYRNCW